MTAILLGTQILLSSLILHLLAGGVAGSVFKVRTLLLLLGVVLFESALLIVLRGNISDAALWAMANIITVQAGYVAGIFVRDALEQAGYSLPGARKRRMP